MSLIQRWMAIWGMRNDVDAFMLAEYKALNDLLCASEEAADRRLNMFLAFLTAAGAALILALDNAPDMATFYLWATVLLAAIRLLGASTLWKLNERNAVYVEYSRAINSIKTYFARCSAGAAKALYYQLRDDVHHPAPWGGSSPKSPLPWLFPLGGAHQTIMIVNVISSFVAVLFFGFWLDDYLTIPIAWTYVAAGAFGLAQHVAQNVLSRKWINSRILEGRSPLAECMPSE